MSGLQILDLYGYACTHLPEDKKYSGCFYLLEDNRIFRSHYGRWLEIRFIHKFNFLDLEKQVIYRINPLRGRSRKELSLDCTFLECQSQMVYKYDRSEKCWTEFCPLGELFTPARLSSSR